MLIYYTVPWNFGVWKSISKVPFNGKDCLIFNIHFQVFLEGKGLQGSTDGKYKTPIPFNRNKPKNEELIMPRLRLGFVETKLGISKLEFQNFQVDMHLIEVFQQLNNV